MKKQTHREPALYIVGNKERADEIKHIIEDDWGGDGICGYYKYDDNKFAYYISLDGNVHSESITTRWFVEAVANGWMKEYELPKKPQFKPFDKVLVKVRDGKWNPAFFGYVEDNDYWLPGYGLTVVSDAIIIPYNEQTEKLIGTRDECKGGNDE